VVATYRDPTRGSYQGEQSIGFCLSGAPERDLFAREGLRVSVINPNRHSTSSLIVVLGDP